MGPLNRGECMAQKPVFPLRRPFTAPTASGIILHIRCWGSACPSLTDITFRKAFELTEHNWCAFQVGYLTTFCAVSAAVMWLPCGCPIFLGMAFVNRCPVYCRKPVTLLANLPATVAFNFFLQLFNAFLTRLCFVKYEREVLNGRGQPVQTLGRWSLWCWP